MSQQTASAGRSSVKSKAGASKPDKALVLQIDSPSSQAAPVPPLLSMIQNALTSASEATARLDSGFIALKNEISPPPDPVDEGTVKAEEEKAPEVVEEDADPLFAAVREAVLLADTTIDKFCLKRRAGVTQAEAKKGVSSALEKLADDVWRAVAEAMEKPHASNAEEMLYQLQHELETLKQSLADTSTMMESLITLFQQTDESHVATREQLSIELQAEGRHLLESFQRYTTIKHSSQATDIRREMDELLGEMVTAMLASKGKLSYSEDSETFKLKKEVARIRQRVQSMCKTMEEVEVPLITQESVSTPGHVRRGQSLLPEDIESLSERSSFRPHSHHSSISIDAEELKNEISKHLNQSHETLISELKEHKLGLSSMNQIQKNLQAKQETINSEIADIKKKLFEVFPGATTPTHASDRGKSVDLGKALGRLKVLGPEIRSNSDVEFIEKFAMQVDRDRKAREAFLSLMRSEGLNIVSLDEAASEISKLKSENQSLLESNEDSLLKMIRCQSEFEIETEFMKARIKKLEEVTTEPREATSPGLSDKEEVVELRDKLRELSQENARLRGDFFDASNVEPIPEALDFSKQDEVTYLKMQLSQKKQILRKITEEKKLLEQKVAAMTANPQELMGLGEKQDAYEKMTAEIRKLTTHIQRIEGGETPYTEEEIGGTKDLEMKSVNQKMADYIRVVLSLAEGFEVCGMVTFADIDWVLVRVGSGFVWAKADMDRFTVSKEEAIEQYTQAVQLLEGHPRVPKSPVLALGYLLEMAKA